MVSRGGRLGGGAPCPTPAPPRALPGHPLPLAVPRWGPKRPGRAHARALQKLIGAQVRRPPNGGFGTVHTRLGAVGRRGLGDMCGSLSCQAGARGIRARISNQVASRPPPARASCRCRRRRQSLRPAGRGRIWRGVGWASAMPAKAQRRCRLNHRVGADAEGDSADGQSEGQQPDLHEIFIK